MRRALLLLVVLISGGAAAHAQAPKGTPIQHEGILTWTASAGASGYNAYRCSGTCTLTTGTFAVLNPAPFTPTTYTDTAVVQGTTYSWCVTSLATLSTGPFETECSNIVTGTIPKDPTIPPQISLSVQ